MKTSIEDQALEHLDSLLEDSVPEILKSYQEDKEADWKFEDIAWNMLENYREHDTDELDAIGGQPLVYLIRTIFEDPKDTKIAHKINEAKEAYNG